MNCQQFLHNVDAMAAGELDATGEARMRQHSAGCSQCMTSLRAAESVTQGVKMEKAPEPEAGFETRILRGAVGHPAARKSRPSSNWLPWGSAVAAALVAGMFIGSEFFASTPPSAKAPAQADTGTRQTVRLAFNSDEPVQNVTLTLELPPNVELVPFPGRHTVSWKVSLKPGDNILALPLNVLFPGQGTLVAHLDDGNKRQTFKADIGKTLEPSS